MNTERNRKTLLAYAFAAFVVTIVHFAMPAKPASAEIPMDCDDISCVTVGGPTCDGGAVLVCAEFTCFIDEVRYDFECAKWGIPVGGS